MLKHHKGQTAKSNRTSAQEFDLAKADCEYRTPLHSHLAHASLYSSPLTMSRLWAGLRLCGIHDIEGGVHLGIAIQGLFKQVVYNAGFLFQLQRLLVRLFTFLNA